jgi:hypothetical protein
LHSKKGLEQIAALWFSHAAGDFTTVVQSWKLEQVQGAAGGASLGIVCPEHDASQAHVNASSGTHGARLFRDVKCAISKPPVADGFLGRG